MVWFLLVGVIFAFLWGVYQVFEDLNRPDYIEYGGEFDNSGEDINIHLTLGFDPEYHDLQNVLNVIDFNLSQASEGYFPIQIHWLFSGNNLDVPICVKNIYFLRSPHIRSLGLDKERFTFAPREFDPVIEVDDLCFQGTISLTKHSNEHIVRWEPVNLVLKTYTNQLRRFPLDGTFADFFVWAEVHLQGSEEIISIAPSISFINTQENWDQMITLARPILQLHNQELDATLVSIDSQRSLSIRVLSALLLSLTTIFILLLLFISDTGSALEVSIAILLGLWGIQGILIPDYIENTTLIHIAIHLLYLLFAIIALIRFVIIPLESRLTPDMKKRDEISNEAAEPITPTSELDKEPPLLNTQQTQLSHFSWDNWGAFQTITTGLLSTIVILLGKLNMRKKQ